MAVSTKINFRYRWIREMSDFTEIVEMLFPGNRNQQHAAARILLALKWANGHKNALARRYEARRAAGWEDRKAIRDTARCILFIASAVWIKGGCYKDELVSVPETGNGAR
jgi:hypothetical protein